jgi:hypothetical protein
MFSCIYVVLYIFQGLFACIFICFSVFCIFKGISHTQMWLHHIQHGWHFLCLMSSYKVRRSSLIASLLVSCGLRHRTFEAWLARLIMGNYDPQASFYSALPLPLACKASSWTQNSARHTRVCVRCNSRQRKLKITWVTSFPQGFEKYIHFNTFVVSWDTLKSITIGLGNLTVVFELFVLRIWTLRNCITQQVFVKQR